MESAGFGDLREAFNRQNIMNTKMANVLIFMMTLVFLFLAGEFILRLHQLYFRGVPFFQFRHVLPLEEFGWHGTKVFGDSKISRYKIFVVGDSFTDGVYVGASNMYFSMLQKYSNVEIFAYGGGGYGTLQEYMVIDRYFDEIKPDLVILQVSPNDFINNSWELEKESFYNNNFRIRPYYERSKAVYRFPKNFGEIRIFLARHSRVLFFLQLRIEKFLSLLVGKGLMSSVENRIDQNGSNFHLFQESVFTTDLLIKKIKARIGKTPFVAFPVWGVERKSNEKMPLVAFPYCAADEWRRIFKENRIDYLEEIPDLIRKEELKGRKLRMPDSNHWNAAGHEICGIALTKALKRLGYLTPPS